MVILFCFVLFFYAMLCFFFFFASLLGRYPGGSYTRSWWAVMGSELKSGEIF